MLAKSIAKRWLPPILLRYLKQILKRGNNYSGNYPDWSAASLRATGYDSERILEAVKQATLKVKLGEAVYERDSVLFDEIQYSFPVLASLLRVALGCDNQLSVLDFGGSLGSSYFQCRKFLSVLPSVQWSIVEQEKFVRCGIDQFESEELRFFSSIQECHRQKAPNVALLSSVLQYLSDPRQILNELISLGISNIVIDRTPFSNRSADRITLQCVPASIYRATLPFRIFSEQRLLDIFQNQYEIIARFDSGDGIAVANGEEFRFGGMFLART